jgi:aspartate/methionine/tyrosine aminotransferase
LSDEIYERIAFCGRQHVSSASFEDIKARVITVNGFSKAYSMTGWRIGYVHANAELASTIAKIHQQLNTNTAAFIQKAAVAALSGPQDHLEQFVKDLRQRKGLYEGMLAGNEWLTGSHPEGGFFAFLNISATRLLSDEFCTRLLEETGVAVIPGILFGSDFDDYCRVSLVNHTEAVADGVKRISDFVNRMVRFR